MLRRELWCKGLQVGYAKNAGSGYKALRFKDVLGCEDFLGFEQGDPNDDNFGKLANLDVAV